MIKLLPRFFGGFKLTLRGKCGYNLPDSMPEHEKKAYQPSPITLGQYHSACTTGFFDYWDLFQSKEDASRSRRIDLGHDDFRELKNLVSNRKQGLTNIGALSFFEFLSLAVHCLLTFFVDLAGRGQEATDINTSNVPDPENCLKIWRYFLTDELSPNHKRGCFACSCILALV